MAPARFVDDANKTALVGLASIELVDILDAYVCIVIVAPQAMEIRALVCPKLLSGPVLASAVHPRDNDLAVSDLVESAPSTVVFDLAAPPVTVPASILL